MTIEDEPAEFERSLQLSCDRLRRRVDEQKARAEKAEAACAEMRAALERMIKYAVEDRATTPGSTRLERQITRANCLLARPDLGRGMVVEREVLERSGGRIKAALDDIYETWVNADEGGARTCDEATVGALKAVLVDLDALLKKGGAE